MVIRWGEKRTRLRVVLYYGLGVIIFFILFGATTPNTDNSSTTTSTQPSKTVHAKPKSTHTTTKKSTTEQKAKEKAKEKAVTKSEAEKAFKAFDTVSKQYDTVYNQFNSVIKGLSNGSMDEVTAYNDLDTIKSNALTVFGNAGDLSVPQRYSDPKDTFQTGIAELRSSIADVQKYLDDNKTSTMANATNELQQAQEATQTASIGIAAQVIKDGYTPPTKNKNSKK